MLNPIEKFKVAILHINRDWNHCYILLGTELGDNYCLVERLIQNHCW